MTVPDGAAWAEALEALVRFVPLAENFLPDHLDEAAKVSELPLEAGV